MEKVLVIGLGLSGRSAASFLLNRGINVCGVDSNQELLSQDPKVQALLVRGMTACSECDVESFDCVVVSPGVPPTHPLYVEALYKQVPVIGEMELACRHLTQPALGITGTNGKTTVALLVTHVLNQSGKAAKVLGNVGVPITSEIETTGKDEILVLELSSFQLETMSSRVLDAAVILNITPDHLDRYASMEAYTAAKMRIGNCLKPTGVLFQEEAIVQASASKNHDAKNRAAAYLLCREMGVTDAEFEKAAASFEKPPHRIEFVRKVRGVAYYNDSKGTNIDAVIKAVDAMDGTTILIAGGVDKGATYVPWLKAFAGKVKKICAIGEAAHGIKEALSPAFSVEIFPTLERAIEDAAYIAKSGDCILLSPGCASFDMFRDYKHRGEEFKRHVQGLDVV